MIYKIPDLLDEKTQKNISDKFLEQKNWETSSDFWPKALYEYQSDGTQRQITSPCFIGKGDFEEYNSNLKKIISSLSQKEVMHIETLMYRWAEGSCILWHDDNGHDVTCTYYVSDWDRSWGGELLFKDGSWLAPEKNSLVISLEQMEHKTTLRLPRTPERLTLQSFIQYKNGERLTIN